MCHNFCLGLFKDAVSTSVSNGKIKELERLWKETVVVYLEISSRNLSGGTKENHE
jgi:hypothetical protein